MKVDRWETDTPQEEQIHVEEIDGQQIVHRFANGTPYRGYCAIVRHGQFEGNWHTAKYIDPPWLYEEGMYATS